MGKNRFLDVSLGAEKRKKRLRFLMSIFAYSAVVILASSANVLAASVVTSKMNQFFDIVAALVSAVGAVMLLWGVFEFGVSMGDNQGTMQAGALKRVGGGLVMIIAPQIVAALR